MRYLLTPDPQTGCIEWAGHKNQDGYGRIRVDGKLVLTHRLAYELKHGPIPDDQCVLHRCDNRPCCNEAHLFLGDRKANSDDMMSKGRVNPPRGERQAGARLTEASIPVIRGRLKSGEYQKSIAKDFGVSESTITAINTGRSWAHIL